MQFVSNGLQHTMSTTMVFQSSDYGSFKMLTGNRELNETKIKRIIRDINHGIDVLKYYPITVVEKNGRMEIHDGQHRFYICKKLKKPVHYIIMHEERELSDIAKINSNTEKWKVKDFINCYTQQGNKSYELLQQFMDKYRYSPTVSIKLLSSGSPGTESGLGNDTHEFQRGKFEAKNYKEAVAFAEKALLFDCFQYYRDRGFLIAIDRIMKAGKVDLLEMAEKVKKNADLMKKQTGFKEYLFTLEMIMNKGKQIRISIY
jgi:hypothetical protein